jgi:hypothetical protein
MSTAVYLSLTPVSNVSHDAPAFVVLNNRPGVPALKFDILPAKTTSGFVGSIAIAVMVSFPRPG